MDFPARLRRWPTAFALALGLAAGAARADFPDHPVHLVVPFAPGGAVDGAARLAANEISKTLGESIVVDNRPGSGGVIGIQAAARATPDGYTLLLGNVALASAPALYPSSGIDPGDFTPVALVGTTPYVLVVRNDFPGKTLAQLLAQAKAHPGQFNYASAGSGSAIHLAGELFKSKAGVDIVHVPYKGAGPAMTALLGGEVQMMFSSLGEAKPMIQAGRIRALAVTSSTRSPLMPELPTLAEAGVPGYEVTGWYGVYAPRKTPADVLQKLRAAATQALHSVSMREQLAHYEMLPAAGGAKEAGDMLDGEVKRWSAVIRAGHITIQ